MEEKKLAGRSFGKSLPVPSVQELVANNQSLDSIPLRYIRSDDPDYSRSIFSHDSDSPEAAVPVIDLQNLLSADPTCSELELSKLDSACKNWGFFQLINHGVSESVVEKVKSETHEFFKLPMEEKRKFWQKEDEVEGFGQAFVVSNEQKLDWADLFLMLTLPRHFRKPHLFPLLPISFRVNYNIIGCRETIEAYSAEVKDLAMKILENIAKTLKLKSEEMKELFEGGVQSMRMNYYPPCPKPDQVIGLTPHSDSVALTILLQLNQMNGLQIKNNGKWVPVKPLPGAFIINIGDILEILTNGIYRSIEHRAVVNPAKERLSIATFYSPSWEGIMGPSPTLISSQTPAKFKTLPVAEYFQGVFTRKLDGKTYLDAMRIQNEVGVKND